MERPCIVIGGGLAGMVATRRLQQLGLQPTVLERGEQDGGMNNARISGGLFHVAHAAMDDTPANLLARLMAETDGEIDPDLADAYAHHAGRAMEWLVGEGIDVRPKSQLPVQRFALYPAEMGIGTRILPERGTDRGMMRLYQRVRDAGAEVILGACAESLAAAGAGHWTVTYRGDGRAHRITAPTVLVADGGFQANPEMLARYVAPNAALCFRRAMPTATGAGLRMLMAAGAGAVGLGRVYGHLVSRRARTHDTLWPYPSVDMLCVQGILVDRDGDRFPTRAANGIRLVNELARTHDPMGYTAVFDADLWDTAGRDNPYGTPVPNPDLVERGGLLFSAPTLSGLAAELGLDARRLEQAVAVHNADPTRVRAARPPFYGLPIAPGITFTMGGVKTNRGGAVLDDSGQVIPGLYAAGSAVGGLHGGPRGGYVGGLAVALTFGLLAAESVAAYVQAQLS